MLFTPRTRAQSISALSNNVRASVRVKKILTKIVTVADNSEIPLDQGGASKTACTNSRPLSVPRPVTLSRPERRRVLRSRLAPEGMNSLTSGSLRAENPSERFADVFDCCVASSPSSVARGFLAAVLAESA